MLDVYILERTVVLRCDAPVTYAVLLQSSVGSLFSNVDLSHGPGAQAQLVHH